MTWKLKPQEIAFRDEAFGQGSCGLLNEEVCRPRGGLVAQGQRWMGTDVDLTEGVETVPVWPHSAYATESAKGVWVGSRPEVIELDEWIEDWLPGIKKDSRLIAVFPVIGNGVVMTSDEFALALQQELDRIE